MNPVLIENRYCLTKDDRREFSGTFLYRNSSALVFILLLVVSLAMQIGDFKKDSDGYLLGVLTNILLAAGFTVLLIYIKRRERRKLLGDGMLLSYGQDGDTIIQITDHYEICNVGSVNTQHIDFSQIDSYKQTEHLILLLTRSGQYILFKKDCFTIGTYDDFARFLNRMYADFHFSPE